MKSYRTSKQIEARIKEINSLKNPTEKHKEELSKLIVWRDEMIEQENISINKKLKRLKNIENKKIKDDKNNFLRKYETQIKNLCDLYSTVIPQISRGVVMKYLRKFYPISKMNKSGKIAGIFKDNVIIGLLNIFITGELNFPNSPIYEMFFKYKMTGDKFVKKCKYWSYKKLFPGIPDSILAQLYYFSPAGSTAVGSGEYLTMLILKDSCNSKIADIHADECIEIECKAGETQNNGGRVIGQVKNDISFALLRAERKYHEIYGNDFNDKHIIGDGMIHSFNYIKSLGYSNEECIHDLALCMSCIFNRKNDSLYYHEKELFISEMVKHTNDILENGQFTKNSINMMNGVYYLYMYTINEKFTHLKIDSPTTRNFKELLSKPFDTEFVILSREEINTPSKIINLIKENKLGFCGLIKNNNRDSAPHIYWNF